MIYFNQSSSIEIEYKCFFMTFPAWVDMINQNENDHKSLINDVVGGGPLIRSLNLASNLSHYHTPFLFCFFYK